MTFRVGQKVVCVDASGASRDVRQDAVYTVAKVHSGYFVARGVRSFANRTCDGIELIEASIGLPFYSERFRPLVSRQTDISALQALLVPGAKIREEA